MVGLKTNPVSLISCDLISDCDPDIVDLALVVDRSVSVSPFKKNWAFILDFLKSVVDGLTVDPEKVRVALLLFSDKVELKQHLMNSTSASALKTVIDKQRYKSGSNANLSDALHRLRTELFTAENGARADVAKVALIVTDGEDNIPSVGNMEALENASMCKEQGIRLLAVGITSNVNVSRLYLKAKEITSVHRSMTTCQKW